MTDRENMSERSFVVGGFASFVFISFKFLKVIKKYLDCDFYATLNCIRKGKGAIFKNKISACLGCFMTIMIVSSR